MEDTPTHEYVAKIRQVIQKKYGLNNTFVLVDWEYGIMYFENTKKTKIAIDEKTLKLIELKGHQ